jgi:thiol-disulfide isomerase/thioredoxin
MVGRTEEALRKRPSPPMIAGLVVTFALLTSCGASSPATSKAATGPLLPTSPTALPQFDPPRFHQLLDQLRGKPVVINIWASWCGPCLIEAPDLAQGAREFGGQAQFLGVDVLDQLGPARTFIRKYAWTFPSVSDPQGAIRNDLGFTGQPETIILDAAGKRMFVQSGAITLETLRKELTSLG